MKKFFFWLIAIMVCMSGFAQTEVTVGLGNDSTSNNRVPVHLWFNNSASQTIYLAGDIGTSGTITQISYYNAYSGLNSNQSITVYMGETSESSFSSASDAIPLTQLTEVYQGTWNVVGKTWSPISLDIPFEYSGNNNLVITVVDATGTYDGNSRYWLSTNEPNRSLYYMNDDNPFSSSNDFSNIQPQFPDVKLTITSGGDFCAPVSDVTASNITQTSATISWTNSDDASYIVLQYKTAAQSWEDNDVIEYILNLESTYDLTDLVPSTFYNVRVKNVCGNGLESAWRQDSFVTDCGTISILPFFEDFEAHSTGVLPNCWEAINTYNGYPSVSSSNPYNGSAHSLEFRNNYSAGTTQYAIMPPFETDLSELQLSFYTRREGVSSGTFSVGYMSDPTDANTFVELTSVSSSGYGDNDYHKVTVNFSDGTFSPDTIYRIAYKYDCSSNWYWYVDNIMVDYIPACGEPTQMAVTNILSDEVTLTWNGGQSTSFNLYYKTSEETEFTEFEYISLDENNEYTLTGLTPATTYSWYVAAVCDDGSTVAGEPSSFTTACTALSQIPYTWDFENDNSAGTSSYPLPTCWSRILSPSTSSTPYPYVYSYAVAHSGSKSLYFYNYYTGSIAVLPWLDGDQLNLQDLQISFYAKASSYSSSPVLQVGVMTNPDDASTFTLVEEISLTDNYPADGEPYEVTFNNYTGTGNYIALRNMVNSTAYNYIYVDDITLEEIPSCSKPSSLVATPASTSATLSWISNSDNVTLYYAESSSSEYIEVGGVTSPYLLEELTPATTYKWYLTAECPDTTWQTTEKTFTTACAEIETLPYYTNFDDMTTGVVPTCWTKGDYHSSYPQVYTPAASNVHSTPNGVYFYYKNTLALPPISQNIDFTQTQLSFYAKGNGTLKLEVGVYVNPMDSTTFTVFQTIIPSSSVTLYEVPFTDYTSDMGFYVGFRRTDNDGLVFIDDVSFEEIPECQRPMSLTLVSSTSNSATLTWSTDVTTFNFYYKTSEDSAYTVIEGISLDENNKYTLTDLVPATTYNWYVESLCEDGSTVASETSTFITECEAFVAPFLENFSNTMPLCWARYTGLASDAFNGTNPTETVSGWMFTNSNVFGQGHPKLNIYGENCRYWLVTPSIDLSNLVDPALSFDIALTAYNSSNPISSSNTQADDKFIVMVSTDNGATWSAENSTVWSNDSTGNYIYNQIPAAGENVLIPLTDYANQTVKIAFYGESTISGNGDNDLHIDNVKIAEIPTCITPTGLTGISPNDTVTLSWTDPNGSVWEIAYGPSGFDPDSDTAMLISGITETTTQITDLPSGILYDFYVRTDCGSDMSDWSNVATVSPNTIAMGITGSLTITGCGMTITDDGGINNNYSNNCEYTVTIYPDEENMVVTVSGTFAGEGSADYLSVFDGTTTNNSALIQKIYSSMNGGSTGTQISFGPLTSTNGPLTLLFHSDYSVTYPGFVANVTCVDAPDCTKPTTLVASASATEAELTWFSSGSDFNVYYKAASDTEYTEISNVSDLSYTLTNLIPSTEYSWYVVALCGDTNLQSSTASFTTLCTAYLAPFSENFNASSSKPSCWDTYRGLASNVFNGASLEPYNSTNWYFNNTNVFNDYHAKINIYGTGINYWLVTPEIDLSALNNPALTFDLALTDYANSNPIEDTTAQADDKFIVAISTDHGATWTEANAIIWDNTGNGDHVYNQISSTGEEVTISLAQYANQTIRIAFYGESTVSSNGDNDLHIDNVSVNEFSTCPKPSNLTVSNIDVNSANLTWTAGGDEISWNVEYKEASANDWTTATASTTSYQLTGLAAGTTYDVRVQADCGGGETSQYVSVSFTTTTCAIADQCIYTFVLTDGFGDGWNDGYLTVEQNGNVVATLEATDNYDEPSSETVTVTLCDNVSTSLVWHYGEFDDEAGFSISGPDGTLLYSADDMEEYTTYTFTTDCSGSGPAITDPTVATAAATAIAQTTATLNGSITNPDNVTITAKGFEWKATAGGTYAPVTVTGNNLTYNLTGLTANTGYTYKAFITFNGQTVYGNEMTFTTLPEEVEPCDVPTNLHTTDIQNEAISITWDANANVSSWNIRYSTVGGTWNTATSNTNSYTISGLTGLTDYEIQVQANCGNGNLSEWSGSITAQTTNVGIENHLLNSISLYPNPANDVVNVQCTMNNVQLEGIEVIDVYGKVVRTVVGANNYSPIRINVSGLANGMYFVRVTTDEGVATKTFIKK